jgi:hypothetical protein
MSAMTIELPSKLKSRITKAARRLGMRPDNFVREAVEARLKNGSAAAQASLYDLSRDLCGSVTGGPSDLARNKGQLEGYRAWKQ